MKTPSKKDPSEKCKTGKIDKDKLKQSKTNAANLILKTAKLTSCKVSPAKKLHDQKNGSKQQRQPTKSEDASTSDTLAGGRPKRTKPSTKENLITGLSWHEESELQRALYASIAQNKAKKCSFDASQDDPAKAPDDDKEFVIKSKSTPSSSLSAEKLSDSKYGLQASGSLSNSPTNRHRVIAQRKFAEGFRPQSPATSVSKSLINSPPRRRHTVLRKAKTDDFLTFLCLRGTVALPPHLDYFNYTNTTVDCSLTPCSSRQSSSGANTPVPPMSALGHPLLPQLPLSAPVASSVTTPTRSSPSAAANKLAPNSCPMGSDHTEHSVSALGTKSLRKYPSSTATGSGAVTPSRVTRHSTGNGEKPPVPLKPLSAKRRIEWPSSPDVPDPPAAKKSNSSSCDAAVDSHVSPRRFYCSSRVVLTKLNKKQLAEVRRSLPDVGSNEPRTTRSKPNLAAADESDKTKDNDCFLSPAELVESVSMNTKRVSNGSKSSSERTSQAESAAASSIKAKTSVKTEMRTQLPAKQATSSVPSSSKGASSEGISKPLPYIGAAPTYYPSCEQFEDPISYITSIWSDAQPYGICRIVPPSGWKPECSLPDNLRFITNLQYIHKMFNRFGPVSQKVECIKKHLSLQGITFQQPPQVGGVDLDLPALAAAVKDCGGLQAVVNKNRWAKVADVLRIPKWAHERGQKLWDAYVKYLLSYDTLSEEEKQTLDKQVTSEWQRKNKSASDDCMVKSKSRLLSEFFNVGRNVMAMWFGDEEPSNDKVEQLFWQTVTRGEPQMSALAAAVDTVSCGSAFSTNSHSPYSTHGWNFNVIQENSANILKCLGRVSEVTAPVLLMSMLFTATCIHRDLHLLPQIHYLHTGADLIWYCAPVSEEDKLKKTLTTLTPDLVHTDQEMWLPHDVVMVPPSVLSSHGVKLHRLEQRQGEFIIIFPESYVFNVSSGYSIGEIIHFATPQWLPIGQRAAKAMQSSCEEELFSFDQLLVSIGSSAQLTDELCSVVEPLLRQLVCQETSSRKLITDQGVQEERRYAEVDYETHCRSDEEYTCDTCEKICFLSMVEVSKSNSDSVTYCLDHAQQQAKKSKSLSKWKLIIFVSESTMNSALRRVHDHSNVTASRTRNHRKSIATS